MDLIADLHLDSDLKKNCDSVDDESFFDFFVVGDLDKN